MRFFRKDSLRISLSVRSIPGSGTAAAVSWMMVGAASEGAGGFNGFPHSLSSWFNMLELTSSSSMNRWKSLRDESSE
jgi:hypothetical protein